MRVGALPPSTRRRAGYGAGTRPSAERCPARRYVSSRRMYPDRAPAPARRRGRSPFSWVRTKTATGPLRDGRSNPVPRTPGRSPPPPRCRVGARLRARDSDRYARQRDARAPLPACEGPRIAQARYRPKPLSPGRYRAAPGTIRDAARYAAYPARSARKRRSRSRLPSVARAGTGRTRTAQSDTRGCPPAPTRVPRHARIRPELAAATGTRQRRKPSLPRPGRFPCKATSAPCVSVPTCGDVSAPTRVRRPRNRVPSPRREAPPAPRPA